MSKTNLTTDHERPEGIIKALPLTWSYEDFEPELLSINEGGSPWIFNLSGRPRFEVLYFYLLHGGKVRLRGNIMKYTLPNATIKCATGDFVFGKIWAEVGPPIIKAPAEIFMRGFQGFRYTKKLF